MFVKVGKILVALTLMLMISSQWALVQTIAWTTMMADNLRTHSFSESINRTFDGKHPCPICMAIAAAKNSQKRDLAQPNQKLEFPLFTERVVLIAPSATPVVPSANLLPSSFLRKPSTPPPRGPLV